MFKLRESTLRAFHTLRVYTPRDYILRKYKQRDIITNAF